MATPPVEGKDLPDRNASGDTARGRGSAGTAELGDEPSDRDLIESVRQGSTDAYARLYERHVNAAYSMARQVAKSHAEADDLVSEAFVRVLDTMRAGNGPNTAFRAYLLTSVRNTAYDRSRRERKIQLSEDVDEIGAAELSLPFADTALAGLERSMVATAFSRLPERWQAVLWHVEVEGEAPGAVAAVFGLTANGVSALAYRAREGLRQEYLQAHLGQLEGERVERCRATADRLGSWARGGLSKRENTQVETHLDGCQRCRGLAAELSDINGGLRAVIAPAVLGIAAMGYLSTGTVVGATAGAAGGAGAGAGVHAASSVPRQTVGMAASGTALAATVALAIALTGGEQRPVAAPPPPPSPAPTAPAPPAPVIPPESPARPPEPRPAPAPAPAPPAVPNLSASGPERPVELVAGGSPSELPISVRNDGEGPSKPVTVTLSLPQGVTAEVPGASSGSSRPAEPRAGQSASDQSPAAQPLAAQSPAAQPRAAQPRAGQPRTAQTAMAESPTSPSPMSQSRSADTTPASTSPASTAPASTAPASTTPASTAPASTTPAATPSSSAASTSSAPAASSSPGTQCESYAGGIRCTSTRGLAPGESHTFPFRLRAAETAQNGEVSAHVAAGQQIDFSMAATPVTVRPPEPTAGIRIEASAWQHFPWLHSRLEIEVRNTGSVGGRATAVVTLPIGVRAFGLPPECAALPARNHELHCSARLEPGQEFEGAVWLKTPPALTAEGLSETDSAGAEPSPLSRTVTIPVAATLGSAVDDDVVELRRVGGPQWPRPWNPPHLPDQHRDEDSPTKRPAPTGPPPMERIPEAPAAGEQEPASSADRWPSTPSPLITWPNTPPGTSAPEDGDEASEPSGDPRHHEDPSTVPHPPENAGPPERTDNPGHTDDAGEAGDREEADPREPATPRADSDPEEEDDHVTPRDERGCPPAFAERPLEQRAALRVTGCHAEE